MAIVNTGAPADEEYDARVRSALTSGPGVSNFRVANQAAFLRDNNTLNIYNHAQEPTFTPEEGFDPTPELTTAELTYADQFEDVKSPQQLAFVRERLRRVREAEESLSNAPGSTQLAATLLANVADLDTFVPFTIISKLNRGRAAAGALLLGGTETLGQIHLQSRQPDRSDEEVIINGLLAGAFGFAGGLVMGSRPLQGKLDDAVQEQASELNFASQGAPRSSVGAQQADQLRPQDTVIGDPIARNFLRYTTANQTPFARELIQQPGPALLSSSLNASRKLSAALVDSAVYIGGDLKASTGGAAIETRIKGYAPIQAEFNTAARVFQKEAGMSFSEFNQAAAGAARRGDTHANPAVQKAAQYARTNILDPLAKAAKDAGLLPDDILNLNPKGAVSYLTRVYNKSAIIRNRPQWIQRLTDHFRRLDTAGEYSEADYADFAQNATESILNGTDQGIPIVKISAQRGALKERTFNIPDTDIEDFLNNDFSQIMEHYIRTVAPQIELARKFGAKTTLDDLLKQIDDEVAEAARTAGTGRPQEALARQAEIDKANVRAIYGRLTGTLGAFHNGYGGMNVPLRVAAGARKGASMMLLGGMVLGSLPDVARPMVEEGFLRTFRLLGRDMINGFQEIKMGTRQAQAFGTALDIQLSQRARAIADIGEPFTLQRNAFERGLDTAQNAFFKFTGINHWNTMMKGITGTLASTRILQTARRVAQGTATNADLKKLRRARIDPDMARRIAAQEQHWHREGGTITGAVENWTDIDAIDAFRNALISDVDKTIVTPGPGDVPLWFDRPYIGMIGQLKSFMFASHSKVLASGIEQRNADVLLGVATMVALGMATTHAKDILRDRQKPRELRSFVVEGVNRSGVLSMMVEADNLFGKFTGLPSGGTMLAGEVTSRFRRADTLETLAPAASVLTRTARAVGDAIGDSNPGRLVRATPLNNHVAWLAAVTAADEAGILDREIFEGPPRR
ncbi:MAG: hypothetical protein ACR2PR_08935 [Pseudohongiellaceae bacterium]